MEKSVPFTTAEVSKGRLERRQIDFVLNLILWSVTNGHGPEADLQEFKALNKHNMINKSVKSNKNILQKLIYFRVSV